MRGIDVKELVRSWSSDALEESFTYANPQRLDTIVYEGKATSFTIPSDYAVVVRHEDQPVLVKFTGVVLTSVTRLTIQVMATR